MWFSNSFISVINNNKQVSFWKESNRPINPFSNVDTPVKYITSGGEFIAALFEDGTVKAYKAFYTGSSDLINIINDANITGAKHLVCNWRTLNVLFEDDTLRCYSLDLAEPAVFYNVKTIACSKFNSLILYKDGNVEPFVVGNGQDGIYGEYITHINSDLDFQNKTIVDVAASVSQYDSSICAVAVFEDGTVKSAGDYSGVNNYCLQYYVNHANLSNVAEVYAGDNYFVFLKNDKTAKVIHGDHLNQIDYELQNANINNIKKVFCGNSYVIFILEDDSVKVFGKDMYSGMIGRTNVQEALVVYNMCVYLYNDGTIEAFGNTSYNTEDEINATKTGTYLHLADYDLKNKTGSLVDIFEYYKSNDHYQIVNYIGTDTDVVIPSEYNGLPVTHIGTEVFQSKNITSVIIPDSVTSIGMSAFRDNQLTSLVIPDSVTSIGDRAFYDNQLTNITIGNSVTSIGDYAFDRNQLTDVTIPDLVTSIGEYAFYDNQLTNVTIGNSVTSIGDYAFFENRLTNVVIPDSVTSIGDSTFRHNQLTSITIGDSVTSIGNYAFHDNQLTSVIIPDSIITIRTGAFRDNQLTSITIPDSVTSIEPYTFWNNQLASVMIPNSVTSIGYYAFGSNQLTSLVIPDSVITVGSYSFLDNKLTSITIPPSVTSIGTKAFKDNLLTSDYLPDTVTERGDDIFDNNPIVQASELQSISITNPANKLKYFLGEELEITGLVVTGTYNDGIQVETISIDNISGFDKDTAGTQELTITVDGKTDTFNVEVVAIVLESISIKTPATKLTYFVGEILDTSGLQVTGTYSDGSTKIEAITTSNIIGFDSSTLGTKILTITVNDKSTTFNVEVVAIVLESITISNPATKLSYFVGDLLDITGLQVTGTYSDGSNSVETISTNNITGFDSSTEGTKTLTVTVNGKATTYEVVVVARVLESISITTPATKLNYYVGEELDITGLVVTGNYNDGTQIETISTDDISGFDSSTSGNQELTITVNDKTDTFDIVVIEIVLESISITTPATKLKYFIGEELEITGLTVTGKYNNGDTKIENISLDNISGFDSSSIGIKKLTITLGSYTVTYDIFVFNKTVIAETSIQNNLFKIPIQLGRQQLDAKLYPGVVKVFEFPLNIELSFKKIPENRTLKNSVKDLLALSKVNSPLNNDVRFVESEKDYYIFDTSQRHITSSEQVSPAPSKDKYGIWRPHSFEFAITMEFKELSISQGYNFISFAEPEVIQGIPLSIYFEEHNHMYEGNIGISLCNINNLDLTDYGSFIENNIDEIIYIIGYLRKDFMELKKQMLVLDERFITKVLSNISKNKIQSINELKCVNFDMLFENVIINSYIYTDIYAI